MDNFEPKKFTIMVVEDHVFSRKAFVNMLMRSGYKKVLAAENGADAIEKLNCYSVDLIITDINMPEVNGLELIKSIRLGKTGCDIHTHIIAVTCLSDAATVSACMTLEIDSFLVKPITVKNAQDKIKLAVSQPRVLYQQHLYESVNTTVRLEENKGKSAKKSPEQNQEVQCEYFTPRKMADLKEGMTLVDDLCMINGGCLLKAGTQLNGKLLHRLYELSSIIELGDIRVRVDQKKAANNT
ncbi:response regulator [Vibrio marisflavi]|uniref:Sensor histidine kinase RcsC n=1 Tax=Vibrio marisflavi CECT 7928 TaxID=634439 RepID=A0ABM9A3K9_9VIBR|nr:response regulator [Vibrio marisflavi]CAH0539235.1 Sensor histidine kinase RcsC [Vibrio marisflavi CECT 7928]